MRRRAQDLRALLSVYTRQHTLCITKYKRKQQAEYKFSQKLQIDVARVDVHTNALEYVD